MDLEAFREEAKAYIGEKCPDSMRNRVCPF